MLSTLVNIELRKLLLNRSAVIIYLLFIALALLSIYLISGFISQIADEQDIPIDPLQQLAFPDVWAMVSFQISYAAFLLPAIVVVITCGELQSGIIRQHIIEGLSRRDLLIGKIIVILILVIATTIIYTIASLFVGFYFSESVSINQVMSGYPAVLRFALYLLGTCMLALTFAYYIGTTGLSLIAILGYIIILEPSVVFFLSDTWAEYLPNTSFRELLSFPLLDRIRGFSADPAAASIASILWIVVLSGLCYLKINRKDF